MKGKPAIEGGRPIRRKPLPFYRPVLGKQEIKAVVNVINSGWLISGKVTEKFEDEFRKYIGAKFAVSVSSCTAGLHLSLASLGIKENDEVITTPMTFAATANCIVHQRAKPVFVDIEKNTLNIDPKIIAKKISSKTKAIIPVHIGGRPCLIDEILEIAKKINIPVIEDAAHALGSEYRGKRIGTFGETTVFSFHAVKNITTIEGGMITTDNQKLVKRMNLLKFHGIDKVIWSREGRVDFWKYKVLAAGYKYNLSDVQSAMGIEQLKCLNNFLAIRNRYAKIYNEFLKTMPEIEIPNCPQEAKNSWHLYIIKLKIERLKINRDQFIEALRKENIFANVHFMPLNLQPFYQKNFGYKKGNFPNAEDAYSRIVTLPLYPKMTLKDLDDVILAVEKIISYYRR